MFERKQRPLTPKERKLLEGHLKRIEKQRGKGPRRLVTALLCFFGPLWLLTVIFVKDLSTLWLSVFWAMFATVTGLYAFISASRDFAKDRKRVLEALNRDRAEEIIISASEMVEFEEVEDEGACYAFQVAESQIVFVCGQDFYPTRKFPSTNFSIIDVSGFTDVIQCRGPKLKPARVIDGKTKERLKFVEHLQLIEARLDQLEKILTPETEVSRP